MMGECSKQKEKLVLHVISGLGDGGAEGVLYRICKFSKSYKHIVVSMTDEGKYGQYLDNENIKVYFLKVSSVSGLTSGMFKLRKIIKRHNPDIIQTWMYHADLFAGLLAKFMGKKNIFWNVRNSDPGAYSSGRLANILPRLSAFFSGILPSTIIFCGERAALLHQRIGYKSDRSIVIGNGYDTNHFYPNAKSREAFREESNIPENAVTIGMVARYDRHKDHPNLINALALLKRDKVPFICFLIGSKVDAKNDILAKLIDEGKLSDSVVLLGARADIPYIMNGLDLHILSSAVEGFPNVIAEAMACGTPCVSTDVGDARSIVGDTGWIVSPSDAVELKDALKEAILEMKNDESSWQTRKFDCRERVLQNFSVMMMIKSYEDAWSNCSAK